MSDRDALLAAILAHPDDDTPRLVYADWLDEHDEPERAEFIRVQCRLARLSRYTAEAKKLAPREAELRKQLFKHFDKLPFKEIAIRRGFVKSVISALQIFTKHAPKLRAEDAPAYELILAPDDADDTQDRRRDDGYGSLLDPLTECEVLRRCISLEPHLYLHSDTAEILFGSPHLTGLRRLSAYGDAGDAFEDLDSPVFANLRWLNLHGNDDVDSHPPTITQLAHSAHLVNLEHLDLGECNLDDECLRALSTTPHLQCLRSLNISQGWFPNELAKFFRTTSLPALTELDLCDTLGRDYKPVLNPDECMKLLSDSPLIERLTKLTLRRNQITDEGALAIANSPRKLRLVHLDLWANDISTIGKRALEKRLGKGVCAYKQPK